jgi:PKD repeat protein
MKGVPGIPGIPGILLLALAGLACGKTQAPVSDAAVERPIPEVAPPATDVPPTLAVDFAVEGCPSFDPSTLSCTGSAPLTLRFVPLVTTSVSQYIWDFGPAQPTFDTSATPSHSYLVPGQYTVKLVVSGLDGVVVSKAHEAFVTVTANQIGDPCDQDDQCADKLTCLCSTRSPCDYGPPRGTCASTCQSGSSGCGDGQVCAGLMTATPSNGVREAWQTSLCLRRCSSDADCSDQLRCRLLPPGPGSNTWVNGCFGDLPADVGQSCADAANLLRDDLCASGICANLGAKGMCTLACSSAACAPGSDCAILGDGRRLCLRPCSGAFACTEDALLGCELPGAGDLGYHFTGLATESTYCAPRSCASDDDCLPSGKCDSQTDGHCVPRSD